MSFSASEIIDLSLRDGSRLRAGCFGDFVLLRRPAGAEKDMAKIGKRLFEEQFGFVQEVIATEVELCLVTNQSFETGDLSQIEAIDFAGLSGTRSQHHQLPILIDEHHADWEFIEAHTKRSQRQYLERLFDCPLSVAMTGFLPGFVYLNGLPRELHVPRKATPATRAAAGTFAVGGHYAGVYSLPSSAGWNCIGTIAKRLFCERSLPPVSVSVGDTLELRPVNAAEFEGLREAGDRPSEVDPLSLVAADVGRLRFEHPGLLSLIQDRGRVGYAWYAIPQGGCMDASSAEMANVILGKDPTSPLLEFHFVAPRIRFLAATSICLTGADLGWAVNGAPIKRGQTLDVASGDLLSGSSASSGCRAYMAIHGQIETQRSFGSASTYPAAKLGGNHGSALVAGDELCWSNPIQGLFRLQVKIEAGRSQELAWVLGPEFSMLDPASQKAIFHEPFCINRKSDRMGARLDGPALSTQGAGQMIDSVPLLPGMVQLTPAGQLIVVLQDGQTTGGYPRVGFLNRRAVERLNQTKIDDPFRFKCC